MCLHIQDVLRWPVLLTHSQLAGTEDGILLDSTRIKMLMPGPVPDGPSLPSEVRAAKSSAASEFATNVSD